MQGEGLKEFTADVHCSTGGRNGQTNILMAVPTLSQYVENYVAYTEDINPDAQTKIGSLSRMNCPRAEDWQNNCDGSHEMWTVQVILRRMALKNPPQSGANAGVRRDPAIDYNYKWEIAEFLNVSQETNQMEMAVETRYEAKSAPKVKETLDYSKPNMDSGDIVQLRRSMEFNDGRALDLAVQWFTANDKNFSTELNVDLVTGKAELFAEWLNRRSSARYNSHVSAWMIDGAVVTKVTDKSSDEREWGRTDDLSAKPDFEDWLDNCGISKKQMRDLLKAEGYTNSEDWFAQNEGANYADLAEWVKVNLDNIWPS